MHSSEPLECRGSITSVAKLETLLTIPLVLCMAAALRDQSEAGLKQSWYCLANFGLPVSPFFVAVVRAQVVHTDAATVETHGRDPFSRNNGSGWD